MSPRPEAAALEGAACWSGSTKGLVSVQIGFSFENSPPRRPAGEDGPMPRFGLTRDGGR
jgi:hypothetical protein